MLNKRIKSLEEELGVAYLKSVDRYVRHEHLEFGLLAQIEKRLEALEKNLEIEKKLEISKFSKLKI